MNEFYQWLYDHYAVPQIDESAFPASYQAHKQEWLATLENQPTDERLLAIDLMNLLKMYWGTQSFAYGVQAGLLLASELPRFPPDLQRAGGFISPAAR